MSIDFVKGIILHLDPYKEELKDKPETERLVKDFLFLINEWIREFRHQYLLPTHISGGMFYTIFFYVQHSLKKLYINTITALDKYKSSVTFLPTKSWALDNGFRMQRPKQDNSVVTCSILAPL